MLYYEQSNLGWVLLFFSPLFTIENLFSKSYLHITAWIDYLHLLKKIEWVKIK